METVTDWATELNWTELKITADGDCSHEIKRRLLLGRKVMTNIDSILKSRAMRKVKDGGGIGWGDHFLPHKFIERTFEHWANSTKQLLNSGRGHQAPRKAAHCLRKEVGKNIKVKRRDERGRDGARPGKGVLKKREVSKHQETLSLPSLWWALEQQRAI